MTQTERVLVPIARPPFTGVSPCGYCGERVAVFGVTWTSVYDPPPPNYPWRAEHVAPACEHWPKDAVISPKELDTLMATLAARAP
mgnify:FL=1